MRSASGSPKKAGYHHNDLPGALMDTALKMIVGHNGPHFSLRELAAAVGVTHPSVYRHFKDKAALLDGLTERGFRELRRYQAEEQEKAPRNPLDQLYALCQAYVRFAQENPGFFSLMFDSLPEKDIPASGRNRHNAETLSTLVRAIETCQQAGVLIPGDPGRIAGYLVLAPHGLASYTAQSLVFDHAEGNSLELMSVEGLAELLVVPLLIDPPAPDAVAAKFFAFHADG